jgi:hypothetical protein
MPRLHVSRKARKEAGQEGSSGRRRGGLKKAEHGAWGNSSCASILGKTSGFSKAPSSKIPATPKGRNPTFSFSLSYIKRTPAQRQLKTDLQGLNLKEHRRESWRMCTR